MNWIIENKEWIFSGIGVFAISIIIALFKCSRAKTKLTQKSGANSVNLQAGDRIEVRDVKR